MITLTFRPVEGESTVVVRGRYFRICSDGTLRGPDNAVAARYTDGLWHLAHRRHRSFECGRPVYLRVTDSVGERTQIGPYDFLKATNGAIFTRDSCLGVHTYGVEPGIPGGLWREIAFLPATLQDTDAAQALR